MIARPADERVNWVSSTHFLLVHALVLLAVFTGVTWTAAIIFVVSYVVRLFAITAGYHRYFSHRSFRVSRPVQFVMAFVATTAVQKGPLWWASHHRRHHRNADEDDDIHSPQKGFWWSHIGWIMCDKYKEPDLSVVRDLAKFPELRFLDRHEKLGPFLLGTASYLIGGWSGLIVGFFASTVVLWHVTFTINSLSHTIGRRRFATTDTSRNNAVLALLTFGEGWHNNHHHYQASARQGFYWWEIDLTWYALRFLSLTGVVRRLRVPSADVLERNRLGDGAFDLGMFRASRREANAQIPPPRTDPTATPGPDPMSAATRSAPDSGCYRDHDAPATRAST